MKIIFALFFLTILLPSPISWADPKAVNSPPHPSIGLALGSGGAAGLAHIAMLQVFDDLKLKPERITGTSIGAVIGVLYAAGLSAEKIRGIFSEFGGSSLDALSRLMSPSSELTIDDLFKPDLENGGFIDSSGFLAFLAAKMPKHETFADLAIPLEVVATDYWTGQTVVLDKGELWPAVKASMAVPGLFSPVLLHGRLLIDGGTSNPLPFDLLQGRHDLVVAVDVSGSRSPKKKAQAELTDIVFGSFEIMQQSMISARLKADPPDIYIKPEIQDVRLLHFYRIDTILEQAKPAARKLKHELASYLKH